MHISVYLECGILSATKSWSVVVEEIDSKYHAQMKIHPTETSKLHHHKKRETWSACFNLSYLTENPKLYDIRDIQWKFNNTLSTLNSEDSHSLFTPLSYLWWKEALWPLIIFARNPQCHHDSDVVHKVQNNCHSSHDYPKSKKFLCSIFLIPNGFWACLVCDSTLLN